MASKERTERLRRYWDKHARSYDKQMGFFDRHFFGDTRAWICAQASGDVLEVAIGTGLNLPHDPEDVRLTAIEWSPATLELARRRATVLGLQADLREGDVQALDFREEQHAFRRARPDTNVAFCDPSQRELDITSFNARTNRPLAHAFPPVIWRDACLESVSGLRLRRALSCPP